MVNSLFSHLNGGDTGTGHALYFELMTASSVCRDLL